MAFFRRSLVPVAFGVLLLTSAAWAADVPAFTPNVVDPGHTLSAEDVDEVNAALEAVRAKADIWGAVFIVDELGEDSIESLAERAFRTWKLGRAKDDNGLLLVLAMKDRKSRFEVGYGLEGDLPDVTTRHVLDDVLRGFMRQGRVKDAIVQSFFSLANTKSKKTVFDGAEVEAPSELQMANDIGLNVPRGFLGLFLFYFCLWIIHPLAKIRAFARARRLAAEYPEYKIENDKNLNNGKSSIVYILLGKSLLAGLALRGFLTLNPGIFIFFGSALHELAFAGLAGASLLGSLMYYRNATKRYQSPEVYRKYLEALRRRNKRLVDKGYMNETSPGVFEYTTAYYSSAEYRASRSSSSSGSSSSSSSSSSGGGSSGGGGSSSSW